MLTKRRVRIRGKESLTSNMRGLGREGSSKVVIIGPSGRVAAEPCEGPLPRTSRVWRAEWPEVEQPSRSWHGWAFSAISDSRSRRSLPFPIRRGRGCSGDSPGGGWRERLAQTSRQRACRHVCAERKEAEIIARPLNRDFNMLYSDFEIWGMSKCMNN